MWRFLRQVAEALVERHAWRISARGSSGRWARGRASRVHPHRFGGVEFRLGKRELGHLHGSVGRPAVHDADPRDARRDRPRASRTAFGVTGWVSQRPLDDDREVIELFRLGYERARVAEARRRRVRRVARRSASAPTLPPRDHDPDRGRLRRALHARAAMPTAPLGSTTSFSRSNAKRIASTICSSVTVTISSTSCWPTSHVRLPGRVRLQPVGDRARHVDRDALAARERLLPVVARLRLDADDAAHAEVLGDRRGAGDQPAAADRHDERVDGARVLDQLERRRSLRPP